MPGTPHVNERRHSVLGRHQKRVERETLAEGLARFFGLLLFAHWGLIALDGALGGVLIGGLSAPSIRLLIAHHAFALVGLGVLRLHRWLLVWPVWWLGRLLRHAHHRFSWERVECVGTVTGERVASAGRQLTPWAG